MRQNKKLGRSAPRSNHEDNVRPEKLYYVQVYICKQSSGNLVVLN